MKIQSLKIKSFLGVREWSATFDRKIAFIHGPNASGKSSIRDAILFALTGKARGLEKKKDAAFLANRADLTGLRIEIEFADGLKIIRSASAVSPAQSVIDERIRPELAGVVMNAFRFPDMTTAERRDLVRGLADPSGIATAVKAALAASGIPDTSVAEIVAIATAGGIDNAEEATVEKRRDARRRLSELEAQTVPPAVIKIGEIEYELAGIDLVEIRSGLAAIREELAGINAKIGTARIMDGDGLKCKQTEVAEKLDAVAAKNREPVAEIKKQIDEIARSRVTAQRDLDNLLDAHAKMNKLDKCPLYSALECPVKGAQRTEIVRGIADRGTAARTKLDDLTAQEKPIRERLAVAEERDTLERTYEDILAEIARLPADDPAELERQRLALEKRMETGMTLLIEWERWNAGRQSIANAGTLRMNVACEIECWDMAVKSIGADSPLRRNAAKKFDIGRAVRAVAEHLLPGRKLEIDADYEPRLDGVPLQFLSRSERFRVGIAFADAISHAAGLRLLVLDECDVLRGESQYGLFGFLRSVAADYETIIVMATTETEIAIDDPDIRIFQIPKK